MKLSCLSLEFWLPCWPFCALSNLTSLFMFSISCVFLCAPCPTPSPDYYYYLNCSSCVPPVACLCCLLLQVYRFCVCCLLFLWLFCLNICCLNHSFSVFSWPVLLVSLSWVFVGFRYSPTSLSLQSGLDLKTLQHNWTSTVSAGSGQMKAGRVGNNANGTKENPTSAMVSCSSVQWILSSSRLRQWGNWRQITFL